jgi:hypothetical protein
MLRHRWEKAAGTVVSSKITGMTKGQYGDIFHHDKSDPRRSRRKARRLRKKGRA